MGDDAGRLDAARPGVGTSIDAGTPIEAATSIEAAARTRMDALADDVVPALIARLEASGLGELEVRQGGWRVRLRRAPASAQASDAGMGGEGAARAGVPGPRPRTRGASSDNGAHRPLAAVGPGRDGGSAAGEGRAGVRSEAPRHVTHAPAVGYYSPRDDLAVGTQVRAGDLIGHIDVLGVRQDVVSPADGMVGRLFAQPGEAVEYGQSLVRVDAVARSVIRQASETAPGLDRRGG